MSVQASCTQCDFTKRFSPELGGKFYRCPRCRQGVVAVPKATPSAERAEPPLRLSATSIERGAIPPPRARDPRRFETQEQTLLGETAVTGVQPALQPGPPSPRAERAADEGEGADSSEVPSEDQNRGRVAVAHKILVECGLCGYHVRIPAEFFGKTVHCPECAGNTVFSESTLDPVKDELLDRLALETTERRALFPAGRAARLSRLRKVLAAARARAALSFLVGVGLGLALLFGARALLDEGRADRRHEAVERALNEGWRYGANPAATTFHEPWCDLLDLDAAGPRVTAEALRDVGGELHACE